MKETSIGALIRRQRLAAGLTQATLSSRIHVSTAAVSKWERGVSHS